MIESMYPMRTPRSEAPFGTWKVKLYTANEPSDPSVSTTFDNSFAGIPEGLGFSPLSPAVTAAGVDAEEASPTPRDTNAPTANM